VSTKPEQREEKPKRSYYFINEIVEDQLRHYIWTGCTDVGFRDKIMSHATELIRQIIRKQRLHTIYPGQDDSAFGDLLQTAWCITPDSLVFTEDGLTKIGDILPDIAEGSCSVPIFGAHGLDVAEYFVKRMPTRTYKVRLKQHYQLEATGEHPFLVLTANGPEWISASQLAPGDLVAVQAGQMLFGQSDTVIEVPQTFATYNWWPTRITEDLAYIIGLFIAEGSFSHNRVTIYNYDPNIISYLSTNPAGLAFSYEGDGRNICNRTRFSEFLRLVGVPQKVDCYTKTIPRRMLRCSIKVITALIQGMFDGDGHSSRYNGEVGYTSSSKCLIDELRVLLLNFGIYSKTSIADRDFINGPKGGQHIPVTSYQLKLSSIESRKFYDSIGFRIPYKQEKMKHLPSKPFQLLDHITTSAIKKELQSFTKSQIKSAGFDSHLLRKKKSFTLRTAMRLISNLNIESAFVKERVAEYTSDVRTIWLPIEDIVSGFAETVDVRVRDHHNFTANGIITHNCQIERTLYKFRARPHCRKCYNPDRPNDSLLYAPGEFEYGIVQHHELVHKGIVCCPKCKTKLVPGPAVKAAQDQYGGSTTILYRGPSKVFNMWSQIARTVILAYIKKEARDRKNANSYRDYIDNKPKSKDGKVGRFLDEARAVCKYNDDHLKIIDALERIWDTDDRPDNGIISKLVEESELPRTTVASFIRMIRLRSLEFTDSPISKTGGNLKTERRSNIAAEFEDG